MTILLSVLAAAMLSDAPTDWRAFRGTDATASSPAPAPTAWSDDGGIAWKRRLPGPGSSSPIVVGDGVYVTYWTGYATDDEEPGEPSALRRHLARLAIGTGEVVWTVDVEPVETEDAFGGRMALHGYASSTPVSDGERVYAFFGKSGVFAYGLDGEPKWRADVGASSSPWTTGSGSSLALCGDLLLVNASDESHSVRALDKATGEPVWERSTEALDQSYGTPLVADGPGGPVVVVAILGEVWGLEPKSGEPRWTVSTTTDGAIAPTVVLGDGVVYSMGGQTRDRTHAIRLGGEGDATEELLVWTSRNGSYVPTPLVHDNYLYWVSESGIAFCAEAASGELVYKERLEGSFYASPVRAGDVIYAVSRQDGTYVLPAAPRFEVLHHNRIESDETMFDGTPAVVAESLFLRSREHVYRLSN